MAAPSLMLPCPSCGASIEVDRRFAGAAVCGYCRSAVEFGGEAARAVGKMSVLPAGRSALAVGITGRFRGRGFIVLGRVRYHWERGRWDEWFVGRDDGTWGWLSDDEGRLSWEGEARPASTHPGEWQLGASLRLGGIRWQVVERGEAVCAGGEGQLPFVIAEGERVAFADLVGEQGQAGTVEWEAGPGQATLFVGEPMAPGSLELDRIRDAAEADLPEARRSAASGVAFLTALSGGVQARQCHHCGGGLEPPEPGGGWPARVRCPWCGQVEAPGPRETACPNCGAGVTLRGGEDVAMATCGACAHVFAPDDGATLPRAPKRRRPEAALSIGDRITLRGVAREVCGWLRYEGEGDGETWHWDEWLLRDVSGGPIWLVESDGHATLSTRLHRGPDLERQAPGKGRRGHERWPAQVRFEEKIYRRKAPPSDGTLLWVEGELPWVAKVGDRSHSVEFGAAPHGLSCEISGQELEWFITEHLPRRELERAVTRPGALPKPEGVGLLQPYPALAGGLLRWSGAMAVFSSVMFVVAMSTGTVALERRLDPDVYESGGVRAGEVEVDTGDLIEIAVDVSLSNAWAFFGVGLAPAPPVGEAGDGELADEDLSGVSLQVSYYEGVDGGERWSEGSRRDDVVVKHEGPPGRLALHVFGEAGRGNAPEAGHPSQGPPVTLVVKRGVWLQRYFGVAMGLSILMVSILGAHRLRFGQIRGTGEAFFES